MDYPPMRGGVARYLSNLAEASNGQMEVLVPLEHPEDALGRFRTCEDVRYVRFWWSGWPKWLPLVKRCLELKDGIIFVSHVLPIGTAAWISKKIGGPDYVVLFHGTDLKRINTVWRKWLLKNICKNAKRLIVNSQATSSALKKLIPETDTLVLTPGVTQFCHPERSPTESKDLACFDRTRSFDFTRQTRSAQDDKSVRNDTRRALGISDQTKVVLSVCRLVERKGIDTLLQAVAGLSAQYLVLSTQSPSKFELVVIGKGDYAEPLHQLASLLKVTVRWIENATDQDVAEWYSAADIFCLPSREAVDDVEGFGIVFLEAAAAGLPVIAGKGWGTEEAVVDGVTGLLVEPSAEKVKYALSKLLDDDQLRRRLGEAGQARALRDFRWEDRWRTLRKNLEFGIWNLGIDPNPQIQNSKFNDIAVVIPCWNHAAQLERTLGALCGQTLLPKEVIVVDNNSNDNPQAVVEKYKDRLPISCVIYKDKQGAPAARNEGARLTSSPFLIFLDADVELVPEALAMMRQMLEDHPEASFVYSDFYWDWKLFRGRAWDAQAIKQLNWIHTTTLIRRSALVPFDETLKKFQDWDLWLSMSERGQTGIWIPRPLFKVIKSSGRTGKISHWLPSAVHRIPWPILGWMPDEIRKYKEAEAVIRQKHNLVIPAKAGIHNKSDGSSHTQG
ncbi:MAG: glycosyltransferase [Patescibacteria group bacterium]|jgi:glycosyltransferase involved in cell wall biosynthesis